MIVRELIEVLRSLPPNAEVGVLAASAHARPPVLVRVNPLAVGGPTGRYPGFTNPENAFLIRPQQEII